MSESRSKDRHIYLRGVGGQCVGCGHVEPFEGTCADCGENGHRAIHCQRTKETSCVWRSGCAAPIQCAAAGHCLSIPKDLADTQTEVRPSKPKLEDFPHPQGGYSTMSFHNALIYWQEREIERLQRDNDRLNDYIKGLPDNESCAHPAMKGTQAYKCELCGQLEERNADETTDVRIKNLTRALHAKQAKIDALMLEFCPGEMQAEQKSEWAEHQQRSLEEPRETSRDDARDAARYRYIRQGEDMLSPEDEDHYNKMWQTILPKGCDRKRMDTAIDAAIAKSSAVEPSRCTDCGVMLVPQARHFSGCKSHPGEPAVKAK